MTYDKFVTIEYETPELAATMAARINANDPGGNIRAISKGRTLEVVPANVAVADIFTFFSRIGESVASLFRKSDTAGKATASA